MKHSAGTNGSHAQSANSPIVKPQAPGSRGEGRPAGRKWLASLGRWLGLALTQSNLRVLGVREVCVCGFPCLPHRRRHLLPTAPSTTTRAHSLFGRIGSSGDTGFLGDSKAGKGIFSNVCCFLKSELLNVT